MTAEDPSAKLPGFLRKLLFKFFLRRSFLARGIQRTAGTFMTGLSTYVLKLGPENLGPYDTPFNRRIAASLSGLALRWRLQDMARLLADAMGDALAGAPGLPLHLINIAGGTAMDSLNALIIARREQPGSLDGRRISIDVLDRATEAVAFGSSALAALKEEGGPLAGLDVSLRQVPYDWAQPDRLRSVLDEARAEDARMVGSSEGGLFEYGSDGEILGNLQALGTAPTGFTMVGSVTRADAPIQRLHRASHAATHPRGIDVFRALIGRVGWKVTRVIERPFSDHVTLTRG